MRILTNPWLLFVLVSASSASSACMMRRPAMAYAPTIRRSDFPSNRCSPGAGGWTCTVGHYVYSCPTNNGPCTRAG